MRRGPKSGRNLSVSKIIPELLWTRHRLSNGVLQLVAVLPINTKSQQVDHEKLSDYQISLTLHDMKIFFLELAHFKTTGRSDFDRT